MFAWIGKLRKIMTKIADIVIAGRNAGLYNQKDGPKK